MVRLSMKKDRLRTDLQNIRYTEKKFTFVSFQILLSSFINQCKVFISIYIAHQFYDILM